MNYIEELTSQNTETNNRLNHYIIALDAISEALSSIQKNGITDDITQQAILFELLPHLCFAFNSQGAFCANRQGEILKTFPDKSGNQKKYIPVNSKTNSLLKNGDTLVIIKESSIPNEMRSWGVKSILAVPLNIKSWGEYIVATFNGEGNIPFNGNDKRYFEKLMNILGSGLNYGRLTAETELAFNRYQVAKARGEYNFLSRASEDCIKFVLNLNGKPKKSSNDVRPNTDSLLADYLDAELSKAMHKSDNSCNLLKFPDQKEKSIKSYNLLNLVKIFREPLGFDVWLFDNGTNTGRLDFREYPRTGIAIARICLWAGYSINEFRVPKKTRSKKAIFDYQQKNTDESEVCITDHSKNRFTDSLDLYSVPSEVLFNELPNMFFDNLQLLKNPILNAIAGNSREYLDQEFSDEVINIEKVLLDKKSDKKTIQLLIDYARYFWQRIHYLARNGIIEPTSEWSNEINEIYKKIIPLTLWIIRQYLLSEGDTTKLNVDSDWLTVWLLSNLLLSQSVTDYYLTGGKPYNHEPISGPMEKMRYFTHLSHMILYSLHCVRFSNLHETNDHGNIQFPFSEVQSDISISLSKSLLFILSEYAYREIGVHRELVLLERLDRQIRYELPLYASSEFYRDHLYHVIDVCLMGELLLRSYIPKKPTDKQFRCFFESINQTLKIEDQKKIIQEWYIAALCHDLGYVVESVRKFLDPIKSLKGPGLDQFWESIDGGLISGNDAIQKELKEILSRSDGDLNLLGDLNGVSSTDHGIAAWLHLHNWLKIVNESPQKYSNALNGILRHNLSHQSNINPVKEPITFLLMLCDHLQEWGRPRIGPDPLARGVLESMRFKKQIDFDTKIRVNKLEIGNLEIIEDGKIFNATTCTTCIGNGKCKNYCPRVRTLIQNGNLHFKLHHYESRSADFEPAASWLAFCRDLQCFSNQFGEFPFGINITLAHIPSQIWRSFNWQPLEMDLLQEFANRNENVTYLCEWVEKSRRGNEGIIYLPNRKEGKEEFSICLNKINYPLPRSVEEEHIIQFINWKWHRLSKQYMETNFGNLFP